MPQREEEDVVRVHVHLFKRDLDRLDALFGGSMGRAKAIRRIVRSFINNVEAKAAEKASHISLQDIDLPEDAHEQSA